MDLKKLKKDSVSFELDAENCLARTRPAEKN
jgi:hypothetical protein